LHKTHTHTPQVQISRDELRTTDSSSQLIAQDTHTHTPQVQISRDELRTTDSSTQLIAQDTHTTDPNFTLPNTDYAHKTSQVISVKHV